jgi:hypothetical protein
MPHDHPSSLREERRRDCVVHSTGGLMYFLRWRENEAQEAEDVQNTDRIQNQR